jgi:16S rRNA (cytosine967-C5)-methyltransferase
MIAPARRAAVDALELIDRGEVDLGAAVAEHRASLEDERDRALLLELVAGTLRMRNAIDYQLSQRVSRPLDKLDAAVLRILRLSAFQLLYQSRLPASAVINDAVHLTRRAGKSSAAGLTNAVLRALSRNRHRLQWPARDSLADHLSVVHSHPRWLVERWLARYGAGPTETWLEFNNRPAPMCLAVNRHLTSREALARELESAGVSTRPTGRSPLGLEVVDGRALQTDAFRNGRFVVQDEAAQLITTIATPARGDHVLDLCASPGGKTIALSAEVGADGRVVACDVRPHRVRLLSRTLERCRVDNVTVTQVPGDGQLPFGDASFDLVLIDAPCSGLGTVRRDPDIRWRRSPEDLSRFASGQGALLVRAARLVKAGGRLVYATCSSEPEENDDVVGGFVTGRDDFLMEQRHQTLPFADGLEAFFAAVLRRAV